PRISAARCSAHLRTPSTPKRISGRTDKRLKRRAKNIATPPAYQLGGMMETKQLKELLLQSLEHERGGVKVYETAIKCAQNEDLKEEWEKYHEETEHHVEVLMDVFAVMQLDSEEQSPGRQIVHDLGAALVAAMEA